MTEETQTVYYRTAEGAFLGGFAGGSPPEGAVECPAPPDGRAIWSNGGWDWDAAAAARQEMSLSFAQLMIGLVTEGWITEAEGTAWLAGALPEALEALLATLPAGQRFSARARATRPTNVLRLDPLVVVLADAQGKDDAALDAFFATYQAA
jgi:hypothetical protein